MINNFLKWGLSVLFPCVMAGCGGADVVGPNGYRIECDKGRNCIVITDKGSVPVGPEVDQYEISGSYLIGHVIQQMPPSGLPKLPNAESMKPGYFIVDTQNGNWTIGLSKTDWKNKLSRIGVQSPQLKPTGYDATKNRG